MKKGGKKLWPLVFWGPRLEVKVEAKRSACKTVETVAAYDSRLICWLAVLIGQHPNEGHINGALEIVPTTSCTRHKSILSLASLASGETNSVLGSGQKWGIGLRSVVWTVSPRRKAHPEFCSPPQLGRRLVKRMDAV